MLNSTQQNQDKSDRKYRFRCTQILGNMKLSHCHEVEIKSNYKNGYFDVKMVTWRRWEGESRRKIRNRREDFVYGRNIVLHGIWSKRQESVSFCCLRAHLDYVTQPYDMGHMTI